MALSGRRGHLPHRRLHPPRDQADLLGSAVTALRPPGRRSRAGVGGPRHSGRRAGDLRHGPRARDRSRGHRHRAPARTHRAAMSAFSLELGLGVLLLAVFVASLAAQGEDRRWVGWLATVGVLALAVLAMFLNPVAPRLGGAFAQDGLAIFAKRLFFVATFIGLLGGVSQADAAFKRRAGEYHLLVLASLLGMLVLASARDLILLFVAFELMSIPLYVLAGFFKRQDEAVEASLKFFLVGSVSSAVLAYGLSFVYGATGTTDLARVARAAAGGQPLLLLGLLAVFAGFAFKIAAFPFHMWVPDTYEAAST